MEICNRALQEWGVLVDNFYRPERSSEEFLFFLTHNHRDHTKGLTRTWKHGAIHASSATAKLLRVSFGDAVAACVKVCEPRVWNSTRVRGKRIEYACVPANHCCGAVMWLFVLPNGSTCVSTGDYRLRPDTLAWGGWKRVIPATLLLYDQTHDDPGVRVPSFEDALDALEYAYSHLRKAQRLAVVAHTSGVDTLVGVWAALHGRTWKIDPSCKGGAAFRIGLLESGARESETPDVLLVGESYRKGAHPKGLVFVKPSSTWFMCHRNALPDVDLTRPVADLNRTLRIFYSTHSSFEENRTLMRFLRPLQVARCGDSNIPTDTCEYTVGPDLQHKF